MAPISDVNEVRTAMCLKGPLNNQIYTACQTEFSVRSLEKFPLVLQRDQSEISPWMENLNILTHRYKLTTLRTATLFVQFWVCTDADMDQVAEEIGLLIKPHHRDILMKVNM